MKLVKISQISKIYADVLMSLSYTLGNDTVKADIQIAKQIFESSEELREVIINPTISYKQKSEIIDEVFKNKINTQIILFIKQLIEKNRFNEFDSIITAFTEKFNQANNIQEITVTSAIELNNDFKKRIIDKMQTKLNSKIIANWQIDKDIIGGLTVKYGDNIIDTSIRAKLKDLSKQIK